MALICCVDATSVSSNGTASPTASPRADAALAALAGCAVTITVRYSTRVVSTDVLVIRMVRPLFADCDHIDVRICGRATGAC